MGAVVKLITGVEAKVTRHHGTAISLTLPSLPDEPLYVTPDTWADFLAGGAVVLPPVPLVPCPDCGGCGHDHASHYPRPCDRCDGMGEVPDDGEANRGYL